MSNTITCPNCQTDIEISEALSTQLKADLRRQFEQEKKSHAEELAKRDAALVERERALIASQKSLDQQVEARLATEREGLLTQAAAKAKADVAIELKDASDELAATKDKLHVAQTAELEVRKKARELDEQKREMELTINRQLDEERGKIREEAKKEAATERELKDAEKEKVIGDLRRQIADWQRKAEQGSQQLQGEVMELGLEEQLRHIFPLDDIAPVPKGIHGGDVVHGVHDGVHGLCGSILWESKRTKNWSDGWLPKLRDDQRAAKAQCAILISAELPSTITSFGQIDGVWITSWACAPAVAAVLRYSLIQLASANRALDGRNDKMEILYKYLAGPEFKHRIEGVVEAFVTLKKELEKEKRSTQRMWARREKQLERAVMNTAGMYGDLEGIIGNAMPRIAQLDEPELLSSDNPEDGDDPDADA